MNETYRDPETPAEWQVAVDQAKALLLLEDARRYGLIHGGPTVNVDRCDELLQRGAIMGIVPGLDVLDRFVRDFNEGRVSP